MWMAIFSLNNDQKRAMRAVVRMAIISVTSPKHCNLCCGADFSTPPTQKRKKHKITATKVAQMRPGTDLDRLLPKTHLLDPARTSWNKSGQVRSNQIRTGHVRKGLKRWFRFTTTVALIYTQTDGYNRRTERDSRTDSETHKRLRLVLCFFWSSFVKCLWCVSLYFLHR